jgi:hypothetical protein
MPRLYFDIDEDGEMRRDADGTELADVNDARGEAVEMLVRLAKDELPHNGQHKTITVLVRSEDNEPLFKAALSYNERPTNDER